MVFVTIPFGEGGRKAAGRGLRREKPYIKEIPQTNESEKGKL
jgi:hypothetical protein